MTPAEYVQLKAFARVDGAKVAVLWICSFAFYVIGLNTPLYAIVALLLMVVTPFFVARKLRRFRDEDLNGVISLLRGWAFFILVFFYASILLASAQYVYFAYMDNGYLLSMFSKTISSAEAKQALEQTGMMQQVTESLKQMAAMRPIDYALNVLTMNITIGIVLGLPVAALMRREVRVNS